MAMMNRPSFRPRPSCRSIGMRLSRRTSLMSIATTTERMTSMINPTPPSDEYQNEVPRVRRRSLTLVMAIFGLALVGHGRRSSATATCSAARFATPPPIIKASNEPNKIAPALASRKPENSGNARQDRYSDHRLDRETGLARRAAS